MHKERAVSIQEAHPSKRFLFLYNPHNPICALLSSLLLTQPIFILFQENKYVYNPHNPICALLSSLLLTLPVLLSLFKENKNAQNYMHEGIYKHPIK